MKLLLTKPVIQSEQQQDQRCNIAIESQQGRISMRKIHTGQVLLEIEFQFENKRIGLKVKATYGENLYDLMMLGGYAKKHDTTLVGKTDWDYTNIMSGAIWIDAFVKIQKMNIGKL